LLQRGTDPEELNFVGCARGAFFVRDGRVWIIQRREQQVGLGSARCGYAHRVEIHDRIDALARDRWNALVGFGSRHKLYPLHPPDGEPSAEGEPTQ